MQSQMIPKKFCDVGNGYRMAYVEPRTKKDGELTLVFLHGNPTSSYLWRNIMAPLEGGGLHLVAPDLIGMGDSDKLNEGETYRFYDHADYLDNFLDTCVNAETFVLVIHDWGSALGFWWAYRNPEKVLGIAYMEAMVQPVNWEEADEALKQLFPPLRTPGVGEQLILEQNFFVEQILPGSMLRNLTEAEMDVYRAPYLNPGEDRRPTLTWPREVPINGTPADVFATVETYSAWMATNEIPKLLVAAEPGALLTEGALAHARSFKNQMEVTVAGIHFVQEDSPDEIADAIATWIDEFSLADGLAMETTTAPTTSPTEESTAPAILMHGSGTSVVALSILALHWMCKKLL